MATVVCLSENCVINFFISKIHASSPCRMNSSSSLGSSNVVISRIGVLWERIGRQLDGEEPSKLYCPRRQVGGKEAVAASFAVTDDDDVPPAVVERGKEFWVAAQRSGDVVGKDGEDDALIVTGTGA